MLIKHNMADNILNPTAGMTTVTKDYSAPTGPKQDLKDTDINKQKGADLKIENGASGVLIMNGIIVNEEYNKDISGREGLKKYDEMRKGDSAIKGLLRAVKTPLLAAKRHLEINADGIPETKAQEILDVCSLALFKDVDFDAFQSEALSFLDFGFSLFEKVYTFKEIAGKEYITFKKLGFRKQYSIYRWQQSNTNPGVQQLLLAGGFRDIPDYKCCLFTHEKEGDNYAGVSLLRSVYKNWYMKDKIVTIDAMAHERHGVGIPVIKPTGDGPIPPAEMETLRETLRNTRSNEEAYIELPSNTELTLLQSSAGSPRDILGTINYHNSQIFLSILAQFLLLGQSGGSGSKALSEDGSSLFVHSLEFLANYFDKIVQEKLIRDIVDLNFGQEMPAPKLAHVTIGDDNVQIFSEAVSKMFTAGVITPTVEVENFMRDMLKLPLLTDDQVKNWEAPKAQASVMPTPDKTATEILSGAKKLSEAISEIVG